MSTYTGPSQLATDVAVKLWDSHRDCPAGGDGHCTLGHISTDDVQEVIDLATGPGVAAELRRLADDIAEDAALIKRTIPANAKAWTATDRRNTGRVIQGEDDASALRRRADELDPPAVRQED